MDGSDGEPLWITVGEFVAPHGLRGELRLRIESDFPERLVPGRRVRLARPPRPAREGVIVGARPAAQAGVYLVRLAGVDGRDAAEGLRGYRIQVAAAELPPLPEGRFYLHQIVGLRVEDEGGADLGRVESVQRLPAHDVYTVQRPGATPWLLPATHESVRRIDLDAGRMVVRLIPGLLGEGGRDRGGALPRA